MPLQHGKSKAIVAHNIHKLVQEGYPPKQAVAISLHTAHPSGGKKKKK